MALEFQNPHPVPAALTVSEMPGFGRRVALAVAKATFDIAGHRAELQTQAPFELLAKDTPTALGELPRDDLPRCDPAFEVVLLGQAHAAGGVPCARMKVSMSVGPTRREIQVTGDRRWEKQHFRRRPGDPELFTVMPLTWERAFGGTCAVEIDRGSFVDLSDVRNPAGRGWDPAPDAEALAKQLKSPKGYPQFDPTRLLPNVERPDALVAAWEDAPEPACWAPVPTTSSIHAGRLIQDGPDGPQIGPGVYHRAHPDWVLPRVPEASAVIELRGVTERGLWSFPLPRLSVEVDLHTAGATRTIVLAPQLLALLPEESRCYLVFRGWIEVPPPDGEPRQARLRLEERWAGEPR
jgi:hypothetical protein